MSYPAEIAYFNSPDQELSNSVRVMELYWNRNVDPSRSPCLRIVDRKSFEHCNFLVLRPVLLKLHISTQLIDSFPLKYGTWSCNLEKLLIPLEAHHKAQSSENFLSSMAESSQLTSHKKQINKTFRQICLWLHQLWKGAQKTWDTIIRTNYQLRINTPLADCWCTDVLATKS